MLQRNWTAQPARKECLALLAHEPVGEQGGGVRVRRVLVDHEVKGGDGDRRLEVRSERKAWEFPLLGDAVVHVLVGRYGVVARDHQALPLRMSALQDGLVARDAGDPLVEFLETLSEDRKHALQESGLERLERRRPLEPRLAQL